ncbi:MAG: hypothetical protein AAF518_02440 [Spirochaetota bacterium]
MRDFFEQKIQNFNGNDKVIGVLPNGEEIVLIYESPELSVRELKDYSTGMVFRMENFQEFKNYSHKPIFGVTKNHNIKIGEYISGGQNSKRDQYR